MLAPSRIPLALALAALLLSGAVHAGLPADVITVGPEGLENDCSAATIQEAIAIANADPGRRRIWVRGSFAPDEVVNPGSAIVIDTNLDLEITGGFPRVDGGLACGASAPTGRTDYSGQGGPQDPVFRIRGSGTVTLRNLDISRGDADGDEGGGIDYRGSGALVVVNSVIGLNEARGTGSGGGISFRSSGGEANLVLGQTQVLQNAAQFGGGVYVFGTGRLTVNGSTINGNTARASGGGVYLRGSGGSVNVYLEQGVSLSGNTAGDDGGAMYVANAALEWSGADGEMWLNEAADMGGGIYLTDGASADIFTRGRLYPPSGQYHAAISANIATHGGGIAAVSSRDERFEKLRLSTYDGQSPQVLAGNVASGRGGTIYLRAHSGGGQDFAWPALHLFDSVITASSADRGAAIYAENADDLAPEVYIRGYGAQASGFERAAIPCRPGLGCSRIESNVSAQGAVIDVEPSSGYRSVTITRTTITGNRGSHLLFVGADGQQVVLLRNLIARNESSGALLNLQPRALVLRQNTFADNVVQSGVVVAADLHQSADPSNIARNIFAEPGLRSISLVGQPVPPESIHDNLTDDPLLGLVAGNLLGVPTFQSGGYELTIGSLGVDQTAGSTDTENDILRRPPVDLPGVPNGTGRIDLGAYELQSATPPGDAVFSNGFEPM